MTSRHDLLAIAMSEARRFLAVGNLAIAENTKESKNNVNWYYSSPRMAAAKRSSMDLTKALARFRRGDGK